MTNLTIENNLPKPQTADKVKVRPLTTKSQTKVPFPTELFGETLYNAVNDIVRAVCVSDEMAANSVIAAASICSQSIICIKANNKQIPSSLYIVTSAASGERKTATINLAQKPIVNFERDLINEYKQVKKGIEDEEEISHFRNGHILFDNATAEGIFKRFLDCQPYQGICTSEGATLVGSHALKESVIKTITAFSKFWDGDSVNWVTAGQGTIDLPTYSRLTMHLMIQPELFRDNILFNDLYKEQGFLSRIMFSEPESRIGKRRQSFEDYHAFDINNSNGYLKYCERVKQLLEIGYSIDRNNHYEFKELTLTEKSSRLLHSYTSLIDENSAKHRKYGHIQGIAAKSAEQGIRLAGVIALFEQGPDIKEIPDHIVKRGISIANWYLDEASRLLSENEQEPQYIADAKMLLKWIDKNQFPYLNASTLSKYGPAQIRRKYRYHPAIDTLIEYGYLTPETNITIDGQTLKEAWIVNETKEPDIF